MGLLPGKELVPDQGGKTVVCTQENFVTRTVVTKDDNGIFFLLTLRKARTTHSSLVFISASFTADFYLGLFLTLSPTIEADHIDCGTRTTMYKRGICWTNHSPIQSKPSFSVYSLQFD